MIGTLSLFFALAAGPAAPLGGDWATPAGTLSLSQQGERVTGILMAPAAGCPRARGSETLRGELLEDSLSGDVQLCLSGCAAPPDGVPILLLLSPDGNRLAGALSLPTGCRAAGLSGAAFVAERLPEAPASSRPARAPATAPRRRLARELRPTEPDARRKAQAMASEGEELMREGRFERARERFLEAVRLDPSYGEGFDGVGVTFRARNDLPEALRWYKRALEADPRLGDAYYNIGCVYALEGQKALALRYLRTAVRNGYASLETLSRDPDLAPLQGEPEFRALERR